MAGDPRRIDTFVKADLGPSTCVIVEDNGRRNPKKILEAVGDAGGTLIYVLHTGKRHANGKADGFKPDVAEVTHFDLAELIRPTLVTELSRSMTRARVQQYQRYFADADKVLILLHNDPDPDALASGLALRNLLRRTKTTAIIGATKVAHIDDACKAVTLKLSAEESAELTSPYRAHPVVGHHA